MFSARNTVSLFDLDAEKASEDKTTSSEDIRFARTVQRLQRPVLTELEKLALSTCILWDIGTKTLLVLRLN